jgi:O-methyltransferase involved in polyketide biosynthesis
MQDKVSAQLSGVSATMLGCLRGRADLSKKHSSLFYDARAIELVEKIDYGSLTIDVPFLNSIYKKFFSKRDLPPGLELFTLRARQFDEKVKKYLAGHPRASIVNIAAGLDTTFYRIDNGQIHWYDLDLPAVIAVRRQLLPEPDRVTCIPKSLLDPGWCKDIEYTKNGVFMIAGGVLPMFDETQLKQIFSMLADNFPGGEIVFDALLKFENDTLSLIDMIPPEQRDALGAALEKILDDWWEIAPQNHKDKLNDMIATLPLTLKPKGRDWTDIKAWWYQRSNREREEVWNMLFRSGHGLWVPKDANYFTKLDNRITLIDQFPLFTNIPRDSLSPDSRRLMDYSDEQGRSCIFHLRLN